MRHRFHLAIGRVAVLAAAAIGTQCSSGGDDGSVPQFSVVYGEVIMPRCLPCHAVGAGANPASGNLDMSTEQTAYANLVNVAASGVSCKASDLMRVVPGNAPNSLMFLKVNAGLLSAEQRMSAESDAESADAQSIDAAASIPPCGDTMPDDGTNLSQDQVAIIQDWIDDGAKP
jgi:hypothetical protein